MFPNGKLLHFAYLDRLTVASSHLFNWSEADCNIPSSARASQPHKLAGIVNKAYVQPATRHFKLINAKFVQDALFDNRVALDLVLVGLSALALLMLVCSMGYGGRVKARPQYTFYDSPFSTSPAHFLLAKKKGNSSMSTTTSTLQLDGAAWASMPGGPGRWTLQDDDEGALPGLGPHCGSSIAFVSVDPHAPARLCCLLKAP